MPSPSTILIVDDKLSAREVLRGLLSGQGYDLVFAGNGHEALARAAEVIPDLILLDVMMPDMDGFEVCQRLRADPYLSEVPIIMVTALDDQESRLRGIEAGADDFISKPYNHVELRARVQTITRLNRYRRLQVERSYRQQAEEEVYRRNRELSLLNRVITAAASALHFEDALSVVCQALAEAFELSQATATLVSADQSHFTEVVKYSARLSLDLPAPNGDQQPAAGTSSPEDISLVRLISEYLPNFDMQLVLIDDQTTDPALAQVYDLMRQHGYGSLMLIPIIVSSRIISIIELKSPQLHYFNRQDLTLAQSMATAVGQALETVSLYQELQRHAASLEAMVARRTHELQTERDRTHAILEALGEAVIVTDIGGVIQYLNPAAVALLGFSEEEALGQSWHLWRSSKSRDRAFDQAEAQIYDQISTTVLKGQTWQGEVNNIRQDGSLYDALLTVAPLYNPENPDEPIGFVSVQRDITPFKEAERVRTLHQEREKQAALDRLRHTFLSTVNHEMRTPLALIFQGIEMLEQGLLGELSAEQLDAIMAVRRQSWTLGQMVEGLTRVAAFLSKQETVRPVLAQLEPVFNNLLPLAEFKARSKDIAVETDIAPNLPSFPLDVKQMEEALTQLVDNAIKFNRPGGKIKIHARADDKWIMIAVSDTGRGIEAEQMDKIWQMFEQSADPVRRAQEGLGLGLVLARYIVEAHRGAIEIDSTLGQGTTFTVKLPRTKHK